jgi:hypothetical protein
MDSLALGQAHMDLIHMNQAGISLISHKGATVKSLILVDHGGAHLRMTINEPPVNYIRKMSQQVIAITKEKFYKKFIYIDERGNVSIHDENGLLVMTVAS